MNIYGISHIGNSRNNQEDNFLINKNYFDLNAVKNFSKELPGAYSECTTDSHTILVAVSDGMGGHSSGEVASYLTVKYLADNYSTFCCVDRKKIEDAVANLNRYVSSQSKVDPEYNGMGATLCGVACCEGQVIGFNAGDSRLYRFDNGNLIQISKDHSEGQRLLDLNLLNAEELKKFPNRKAIYRYVGMRSELIPNVFDVPCCQNGTVLLLCSDGLSDVVEDVEIQDALLSSGSLKDKGEKLLNTALGRNVGHGDNITVILIEF